MVKICVFEAPEVSFCHPNPGATVSLGSRWPGLYTGSTASCVKLQHLLKLPFPSRSTL